MTFGPIDLIALEFPGNRFKGEILPEMLELVDKGIIRIIDLVVIMKDQGEVIVRELRELDAAHIAMFDPLQADVNQMITRTDIDLIAGQLAENSTAGIMLIENLWAKKTMQAMLDANGRPVMFERIPHDVVEEALATSPRSPWRKRERQSFGSASCGADAGANQDYRRIIMMRRRRSMMRAAATTAVVVGTAGAVSHHQQQKYAGQEAAGQQAQDQAYEQGVADAQAQQPARPRRARSAAASGSACGRV